MFCDCPYSIFLLRYTFTCTSLAYVLPAWLFPSRYHESLAAVIVFFRLLRLPRDLICTYFDFTAYSSGRC